MVWWIKGLNYYALSNNLICFSLILSFQMEFFLWYILLLFWCLSFCYCSFPHQKLFYYCSLSYRLLVDAAGCRCIFAFIFKMGTLFKEYRAIYSLREPIRRSWNTFGLFLTLFCLRMCSTMQHGLLSNFSFTVALLLLQKKGILLIHLGSDKGPWM